MVGLTWDDYHPKDYNHKPSKEIIELKKINAQARKELKEKVYNE